VDRVDRTLIVYLVRMLSLRRGIPFLYIRLAPLCAIVRNCAMVSKGGERNPLTKLADRQTNRYFDESSNAYTNDDE